MLAGSVFNWLPLIMDYRCNGLLNKRSTPLESAFECDLTIHLAMGKG